MSNVAQSIIRRRRDRPVALHAHRSHEIRDRASPAPEHDRPAPRRRDQPRGHSLPQRSEGLDQSRAARSNTSTTHRRPTCSSSATSTCGSSSWARGSRSLVSPPGMAPPTTSSAISCCVAASTTTACRRTRIISRRTPLIGIALTGAIYEIPTPYAAADLAAIDFVQSANVITLVHPSYAPQELTRTADTTWTLTPHRLRACDRLARLPWPPTLTGGGAGNTVWWAITAIADETARKACRQYDPDERRRCPPPRRRQITWTAVTGAQGYNIYRSNDATSFGWSASRSECAFTDDGYTTRTSSRRPPIARDPFDAPTSIRSAVGYYQQRRIFRWPDPTTSRKQCLGLADRGRTTNFTTSRSRCRTTTRSPSPRRAAKVKRDQAHARSRPAHRLHEREEKMVEGDEQGSSAPTRSIRGSSRPTGSGTLRRSSSTTRRSTSRREARKSATSSPCLRRLVRGHRSHRLRRASLRGYTLVDWDYAQNPHSIVWARSDGVAARAHVSPRARDLGLAPARHRRRHRERVRRARRR
jgi:hypothetical protein